MDTPMEA